MTLGPFFFAAPWALAALAALPILWWLLRATPPPPRREAFPPTRLLLGLATEQQSRERAPWQLVLFRGLIAALMIIGFARPSLAPNWTGLAPSGRTLVVIDDGWTSAPFWPQARQAALNAIAEAERVSAPVFLLQTARDLPARDAGEALTPADARSRVGRMEPKAWRPDRADAAERLQQVEGRFARIVWITDGLDDAGARALAEALQTRGPVAVRSPARTARAAIAASTTQTGVDVIVRRASSGAPDGAVTAETVEGRSLGAAEVRFQGDELTARAHIELPPEIAARAARVRIVGEGSAGAVHLLTGAAARPFVGLIDAGGGAQSLTSDIYYLDRALRPYAALQRGAVSDLVNARAQALILPDAGRLSPIDRSALESWIERGGLLVRFAGPRLANDADDLLPVRLRAGSRTVGGALAWEEPLRIAPFEQDSPFAGLSPPEDVFIRQQVLADPASLEQARVWARLADNSPLVTAAARGDGLIVLYHIGATPNWSDVPLSGLFVEMLRRTLAFAGRAEGAGQREVSGGPYAAQRLLDGYGGLTQAPPDAEPVPADQFALAVASPATPPGLYERAGLPGAIDAARADEALIPLALPDGVTRTGLDAAAQRPMIGFFLGLAALLLALDLLVSLFIVGRLPSLPRAKFWRRGAAALVLLMIMVPQAQAQPSQDPTLVLRLAYVRTGDAATDATSRAGLEALSQVLRDRTAVEPGAPAPVDLARDDLSPYPFLYWPAPPNPRALSNEALANLDRFLAIGGLLFVDTRDAGRGEARPAARMLDGLDAPPLEQITSEHVVARSFYLMRGFPGRAPSPRLWAETADSAQARDGVASLFVGDGDWAGAWASSNGLSGGTRQREMALRFGVNLVMVALTGNYKADQVHVPALLERMGQE